MRWKIKVTYKYVYAIDVISLQLKAIWTYLEDFVVGNKVLTWQYLKKDSS
jgi:hypothetical protein